MQDPTVPSGAIPAVVPTLGNPVMSAFQEASVMSQVQSAQVASAAQVAQVARLA